MHCGPNPRISVEVWGLLVSGHDVWKLGFRVRGLGLHWLLPSGRKDPQSCSCSLTAAVCFGLPFEVCLFSHCCLDLKNFLRIDMCRNARTVRS